MKKKILAITIIAILGMGLLGGCGSKDTETTGNAEKETQEEVKKDDTDKKEESKDSFKVGITIQSLENNYWAGVFGVVETLLKEKGWEYTIIDCKDNSATQISQIENFITSGCDMIMVHPSDPNAIEDVCKEAKEAGVKVMCWDDKMENTDVNWVLDNAELGAAIGEAAGEFISEHYTEDNKAQVAIMNYPQTPILLDRENGILKGLKDKADGKYEVVAQQAAIEANVAQSNMETILQAYPDCKIVCSIGAGGDIGANEAFVAASNGNVPDDMGIFSADATEQQLQAIESGQASRASVGFEGSNKKTAAAVVEMYQRLLSGEKFEDQNVFRPLTTINKDNAAEFLNDYK